MNKWCFENQCQPIQYEKKSQTKRTNTNEETVENKNALNGKQAFEKAVQDYKSGNIEAVAKYVESGYPVLQFNQDGSLVTDYLIFLVCATNYDIQLIKDALVNLNDDDIN